jgi:Fe-S-cluster containining protein
MLKKSPGKKQKSKHSLDSENIPYCTRCGTCCRKGGPTLHEEDRKILLEGHIGRQHLITIRKGELAFSPLSGRIEPISKEIVKIAGKGREWACYLYDEQKSSCIIYAHRPLECRLLKCWDTSMLLSVIFKDTITRADLIGRDEPIIKFMDTHEKDCSVQIAEDLISELQNSNNDSEAIEKLTALLHRDIELRRSAVSEFGLSLEAELFIFGRPLFKILSARGFKFANLLTV